MPTSLVSTGVQFPDSTIQTTAASAGGTITATASGSISAGAPVIMNSDGTVSAVTATGGGTFTLGTYSTKATTTGGSVYNSTVSFDPVRNTAVLFYYDSATTYIYAAPGVISGTSITWGTPVLLLAQQAAPNYPQQRLTSVYAANVGIHACFFISSGVNSLSMASVTVSSTNTLTVLYVQGVSSLLGSYFYLPSVTYNAATSRIAYIFTDPYGFGSVSGFCGYLSSSGVLTHSAFTVSTNSITNTNCDTSVATTSTGKVIFLWQDQPSGYPTAKIAQLPSSGNTLTNVSSDITVNSAANNNYQLSVGIDSSTGNALFAYIDSSLNGVIKVASISGYTLSFGSAAFAGFSSSVKYLEFFSTPGTNATVLIFDSNGSSPMYGVPITVSGLTFTAGSLATFSGGYFFNPAATTDSIGLQFIIAGGNGASYVGNTVTNVTTNLTSTNFLGLSSASYTNGQTATINIVSSTNSSQSGLTAGLKYYVLGGGTLNSAATSNPYAGLARSSTSILVKG